MHCTKICLFATASLLLFGSVNCWQEYIDNNLLGAGLIKGAIISKDDGAFWARSSDFHPTENEREALRKRFNGSRDALTLEGRKYLVLKSDGRSIYGKLGNGGAICVKTLTAIIIGIYNEKLQPGQATIIVENLADYLIDNGV